MQVIQLMVSHHITNCWFTFMWLYMCLSCFRLSESTLEPSVLGRSLALSLSFLLQPTYSKCVCVLWILSESVATSEACATFINLTKKAGGRFFSHFIKFLVWSFGSNLWSPLGSFNMMLHISFKRLLHIVDGIQNFILFLASFM